jgi:hypothetical protein
VCGSGQIVIQGAKRAPGTNMMTALATGLALGPSWSPAAFRARDRTPHGVVILGGLGYCDLGQLVRVASLYLAVGKSKRVRRERAAEATVTAKTDPATCQIPSGL